MGVLDFWKSQPKAAVADNSSRSGVDRHGADSAAVTASSAAASPSAPAASGTPTPLVKTGKRVVNKGEINPETINVISAQKTNTRDLLYTGDSFELRKTRAEAIESGEATTVYAEDPKKQCHLCCMVAGSVVCTGLSLGLSVMHSIVFCYREQHRVKITAAKFCRHAAWLMLPPALVGTTMHYFLCDAFWSKRRNTYGMAWVKAITMNTAMWSTGIGLGTLFWRKGLKLTKAGTRIYYKYPTATEGLELRLVENPNAIFTGMTWTYWAIGVLMGQAGYLCCAAAVVMQNRVHVMMSPVGQYAQACAPWWRREAIAAGAGLTLKREEERPKGSHWDESSGAKHGAKA
jgi:hypothetical protein